MKWETKIISKELTGQSLIVTVEFTYGETNFTRAFKTDQPQKPNWVQSNIDEVIKTASDLIDLYNSIVIED